MENRNILFGFEEIPAEMVKKIKTMWVNFSLLVLVAILVIAVILLWLGLSLIVVGIVSLLLIFSVCSITIYFAWSIIPHKTEWIVEVYGEYLGVPLTQGLRLIFPFFGFIRLKKSVSKSEQMLALHLYEKKDSSDSKVKQGGDIEFLDASSSIRAFFYYLIEDSAEAVYNAEDYLRFIEEKVEGALRVFLGTYTVDEAIRLKNLFSLEGIILGKEWLKELVNPSSAKEGEKVTPDVKRDFENTEFFRSLKQWGINPKSLVISDIELTEEIKKERRRKLVAEKDLEVREVEAQVAEVDKNIKITLAKGDAGARVEIGEAEKIFQSLEGEGIANKVVALVQSGFSAEEAKEVLMAGIKWTGVGNAKSTDKTIIVGGSPANVNRGAEFGTGFNAGK